MVAWARPEQVMHQHTHTHSTSRSGVLWSAGVVVSTVSVTFQVS